MYSNVSDGYAYKNHLIFKKKSHVKPAHHTWLQFQMKNLFTLSY